MQNFTQHVQGDTNEVDESLFLEVLFMEIRVSLILTTPIGKRKET